MQSPLAQPVLDCLVTARSTVEIGANRTGVVEEIYKDRGDRVKQGEIVARFDLSVEQLAVKLSELKADNPIPEIAAKAKADMLDRKLERLEKLTKRRIVAEAERDEVATDLEVARQDLENARFERESARLELERQKALLDQGVVRSPVSGVVVSRNLEPGEYRNEQVHILTVAALDPLYVEIFAPLSELGRIKPGMTASVTVEDPVGLTRDATVTVVDPVVDAASGTFGVRLEMPNPDFDIPAGLRCTARFE
ncbi:MAG: efflux RND transporter periplasmic adaptor subunit [Rhodobiaceae bacterium]|nr:efflux RND transporter periplasmic adaptor subunit [Rhodobiaceae bacterium]